MKTSILDKFTIALLFGALGFAMWMVLDMSRTIRVETGNPPYSIGSYTYQRPLEVSDVFQIIGIVLLALFALGYLTSALSDINNRYIRPALARRRRLQERQLEQTTLAINALYRAEDNEREFAAARAQLNKEAAAFKPEFADKADDDQLTDEQVAADEADLDQMRARLARELGKIALPDLVVIVLPLDYATDESPADEPASKVDTTKPRNDGNVAADSAGGVESEESDVRKDTGA